MVIRITKIYGKGVLLIETITKSEGLKEIESLNHILKMAKFPCKKRRITEEDSKEKFIKSFSRAISKKRYIHISSHGGEEGFIIHGQRETSVTISDFKQYNKEDVVLTEKLYEKINTNF